MAKGDKLVGAMGKGPSKGAMTRVSPGVYRNAEGKLVGNKGQALPQASRQAQMNDATNLALNGVSQYGNIPQSNEPMQTQPLTFQPGQGPSKEQLMQMFNAMQQQPQGPGIPGMTPRQGLQSGRGGFAFSQMQNPNQPVNSGPIMKYGPRR